MKQAEECEDIEEIRTCIDEIDQTIINSLSLRSTYVKCASKYKKTMNDVKAIDRVTAMLGRRRKWAEDKQINPDFIQFIFETIVNFFIAEESAAWRKGKKEPLEVTVKEATKDDATAILSIQKRAYIQEAEINNGNYNIPPILQSLGEMEKDFSDFTFLKAIKDDLIIGSVRAKEIASTCYIGRLFVEPIYQKNGIGKMLLKAIEDRFPGATEFKLFTGANSKANIAFYKKFGYSEEDVFDGPGGLKFLNLRKKR